MSSDMEIRINIIIKQYRKFISKWIISDKRLYNKASNEAWIGFP